MPQYWMITNRNIAATDLGKDRVDTLSYWIAEDGPLDVFANWRRCTEAQFRKMLAATANTFPVIPEHLHEQQKHVALFVHGYNNTWADAARRYQQICQDMFDDKGGQPGLGICVLFTWPSNGQTAHYLADREDARASGPALSSVFNLLYDQAMLMQKKAAATPDACKAKVSVIAHSMGNWVLQNALQYTWERNNKPLLVSLINQCLMVAADVDNDLFSSGETVSSAPSEGLANLCYRITALYTGRDSVLGVSAGLKHFGKRRLGRSGLDRDVSEPDNVWDFDCTSLFKAGEDNYHSAYFYTPDIQALMIKILRGLDRGVVVKAETLNV